MKVVEREPVKTRRRVSTGMSIDLNEAGGGTKQPRPAAGQVAKKGSRAVMVNCEECGEEVRKTLLKTHIKFYHPKTTRGRGRRQVQSTSAVAEVVTGRTTVHQAVPVASPAIVGRERKEDCVVVDSLFANIQLSTTPTSNTIVQPVQEDVNQSLRNFPVVGWGAQTHHVVGGGDQKTHHVVGRGDQKTHPVASSGDQRTHPVPVWGDQERNNPFARERDQTLPAGPEFLQMHNDHYHHQD